MLDQTGDLNTGRWPNRLAAWLGLRRRIREEEELLALNGTLHPELSKISSNATQAS